MENLAITSDSGSAYTTEGTGSSSASESSGKSTLEKGRDTSLRRLKLNEFLIVSGRETVKQ